MRAMPEKSTPVHRREEGVDLRQASGSAQHARHCGSAAGQDGLRRFGEPPRAAHLRPAPRLRRAGGPPDRSPPAVRERPGREARPAKRVDLETERLELARRSSEQRRLARTHLDHDRYQQLLPRHRAACRKPLAGLSKVTRSCAACWSISTSRSAARRPSSHRTPGRRHATMRRTGPARDRRCVRGAGHGGAVGGFAWSGAGPTGSPVAPARPAARSPDPRLQSPSARSPEPPPGPPCADGPTRWQASIGRWAAPSAAGPAHRPPEAGSRTRGRLVPCSRRLVPGRPGRSARARRRRDGNAPRLRRVHVHVHLSSGMSRKTTAAG